MAKVVINNNVTDVAIKAANNLITHIAMIYENEANWVAVYCRVVGDNSSLPGIGGRIEAVYADSTTTDLEMSANAFHDDMAPSTGEWYIWSHVGSAWAATNNPAGNVTALPDTIATPVSDVQIPVSSSIALAEIRVYATPSS